MRLLILQQFLPHYRVAIFNQIASLRNIELTVAHGDSSQLYNKQIEFDQKILNFHSKGPFWYASPSVQKLADKFDIVIVSGNIRILSFLKLAWRKQRPFRLILWGPGVTVGKGFDAPNPYDRIRYWFAKKADAMVFYSQYPLEKYKLNGVPQGKLFVANNTVALSSRFLYDNPDDKNSFFFLGTLYFEKRLDILLEAFATVQSKLPKSVCINVVGDGPLRKDWQQLSDNLGLADRVHFHGKIDSPQEQETFFEKAIACVSPGQAGLSVLQSMAFGVPFVTHRDAITGGERFNIIDGENGVFFEGGADELGRVLVLLAKNSQMTQNLAKNAFRYYKENCSVTSMLAGFEQAIEYVNNLKSE